MNPKIKSMATTGSAVGLIFFILSNITHAESDFDNPKIRPVRDLSTTHPLRISGNAVGRLKITKSDGTGDYCTAFIIDERHIMTNAHCVPGDFLGSMQVGEYEPSSPAEKAVLEMGYLTPDRSGVSVYEVDIRPVESSRLFDYSILRVAGNPSKRWGALSLQMMNIKPGDKINVIHHPEAAPQQYTFPACNLLEPAKVAEGLQVPPMVGSSEYTLAVRFDTDCITRGGSSGAPMFDQNTMNVVGLHSSGTDKTAEAIPISLIALNSQVVRDLAEFRPRPFFATSYREDDFKVGPANFVLHRPFVSVSEDGNYLIYISGNGSAEIYRIARGKQKLIRRHEGAFHGGYIAPNEKTYVLMSRQAERAFPDSYAGNLEGYDLNTGEKKWSQPGHIQPYSTTVTQSLGPLISPNSQVVAILDSYNQTVIQIIDLVTGKILNKLKPSSGQIVDYEFTSNGKSLTAVTGSGGIYHWDIKSGASAGSAKHDPMQSLPIASDISPDGRLFVADHGSDVLVTGFDREPELFSLGGLCKFTRKRDRCAIADIMFGPDPNIVWVSLSDTKLNDEEHVSYVVEFATHIINIDLVRGQMQSFTLPGEWAARRFVGHSKDGRFVYYSADSERTGNIIIFDAKRQKMIGRFTEKSVRSIQNHYVTNNGLYLGYSDHNFVGNRDKDYGGFIAVYDMEDINNFARYLE